MASPVAEPNDQFLARMIVATREGHQIPSADAQRLNDLAQFGPGPVPTMPEERRQTANVHPRTRVG